MLLESLDNLIRAVSHSFVTRCCTEYVHGRVNAFADRFAVAAPCISKFSITSLVHICMLTPTQPRVVRIYFLRSMATELQLDRAIMNRAVMGRLSPVDLPHAYLRILTNTLQNIAFLSNRQKS